MQPVRGFIYFKDKALADVKNTFINFRYDKAIFSYFTSLITAKETINSPGIFIKGEINSKYTRENVVSLFYKLMGINENSPNQSSLSVGLEDVIETIKTGAPYGSYAGVSLVSPFNIENVRLLAKQIERTTQAHDIALRTAYDSKMKKFAYIDIITNENFNDYQQALEDSIKQLNLNLIDIVKINLIKL